MKLSPGFLPALFGGLACAPLLGVLLAACGEQQGRGVIQGPAVPAEVITARGLQNEAPVAGTEQTSILFGDLHVHTTFSPDAFIMSVPLMGGSGLRGPADACDFARYCSGLDFWSINDHAEGITPRRWRETRESIRECNAVAGDPANPDMVAFLGWEWSQVSTDPARHYGHKNVIFLDTAEDSVPARAIAAPREQLARAPMGRAAQLMMALTDFENRAFYYGIQGYYDEVAQTPECPANIDTRDLPENCLEIAEDPRALFAKLNEWGFESIVIPHGNAWGMNTPPGSRFDKQLDPAQHDPKRQFLFELYSGHGNSEEYRDWRAVMPTSDGGLLCPQPTADYLPCCWRAGQIIRGRCDAAGIDSAECAAREAQARQHFVDAGVSGHLTVPGQQVTDWLDCGTCPDCFNEPMDHRPASTAQYALAISQFAAQEAAQNFRFGLIGSSDNHRGQAGTGYKQQQRKFFTEAFGPPSARMAQRAGGGEREPLPYSLPADTDSVNLVNLRNMERQNSFWLTGGLAAVHANGRNREAIWEGFKRKEVYGTSGDRMFLWFDLLTAGGRAPMGSEVRLAENPRFRVAAVGSFRQLPGCPEHARAGLGAQRLKQLCGGECYNPGEERLLIDRIEVVRIRPQVYPDEPVGGLIEDPWRVFECEADPAGCEITFEDEDFAVSGRETVYYVRAIQEPTQMINAANLRCEYDENGNCIAVNPCYGDYRTAAEDDCLAPAGQRAWSSPIFVGRDERGANKETP